MSSNGKIKSGAATVSGPGVDRTMPGGPAVAMSYAITCAQRAAPPATYYVRDDRGAVVARVEQLAAGQTLVYGAILLAAERRKEDAGRVPFTPGA